MFAVDGQDFAGALDERGAVERHLDVLGRGELLADAAGRARGGAVAVAGIALDHGDRALEPQIGEKERDGAAHDGAARDHHVVALGHARL